MSSLKCTFSSLYLRDRNLKSVPYLAPVPSNPCGHSFMPPSSSFSPQ